MGKRLSKIWVSRLLFCALTVWVCVWARADSKIVLPKITVADFERYRAGEFPTSFKSWPFQRGKAREVYKIKEEGDNKYLSAHDDKNLSTQIFREFNWKVDVFPSFRWRWRARLLPQGAAENRGETNDSACGVYVVFGKMTGTALKYTWSTTLKEGTTFEKKPDKMVFKILAGGKKHLGEWQTHCIHIPTEYKKLLGREMERGPTGFGILTDGNAVQQPAACDYDDFEILAVPCGEGEKGSTPEN